MYYNEIEMVTTDQLVRSQYSWLVGLGVETNETLRFARVFLNGLKIHCNEFNQRLCCISFASFLEDTSPDKINDIKRNYCIQVL